ncbi:MAG: hypothetical protein JW936_00555 [Sedimentisphaerales bacterium]|nr:hypothetical protein [Sedimentisphaerales bacterium]
MNIVTNILAQAAQGNLPVGPNGDPVAPASQARPEELFSQLPLDDIWNFIAGISWLHAVLFLATGIIYIIYGWRLFKALVVINFGIIGMGAGILIGKQMGSFGSQIWGGIICTVALATASMLLMKYAVSVLGAVAGGVLGCALWRAVTLPDELIWCGGLAGVIAGGFLAFSSYRVSIMLFSSLQGAVAIAIGSLGLLNDYPDFSTHLTQAVFGNTFLLPLFVIIPTITGLFCQHKLLKTESEWAMPE